VSPENLGDIRNSLTTMATAIGNLQFEIEELYKEQDTVRVFRILQMIGNTYEFVLSERDTAISIINKAGDK
jgi:hypothetical protein